MNPLGAGTLARLPTWGICFLKLRVLTSPFIHGISVESPIWKERLHLLHDTWDTKSVVNMGYMFEEAANFNQPIGSWDVSCVTNMEAMFTNAPIFNQPIGAWNMSRLTSTTYMFFHAISFDQPLVAWDVSKVTTMSLMF